MFTPPPPPHSQNEADQPANFPLPEASSCEVEFGAATRPAGTWLQRWPIWLVPVFAALIGLAMTSYHAYHVVAGPDWKSRYTGKITTYTWDGLPESALWGILGGAGLGLFIMIGESYRKSAKQ